MAALSTMMSRLYLDYFQRSKITDKPFNRQQVYKHKVLLLSDTFVYFKEGNKWNGSLVYSPCLYFNIWIYVV